MKKYVTFVKDEEESRKVQEAVFRAGFNWRFPAPDGVAIHCHDAPEFIEFNCHGERMITRVASRSFSIMQQYLSEYTLVDAFAIINDPFQLDGAKQPEKMISVEGKEYAESRLAELVRAAEELEKS